MQVDDQALMIGEFRHPTVARTLVYYLGQVGNLGTQSYDAAICGLLEIGAWLNAEEAFTPIINNENELKENRYGCFFSLTTTRTLVCRLHHEQTRAFKAGA